MRIGQAADGRALFGRQQLKTSARRSSGMFIFSPTLARASIAPRSSMAMFSIFSRFQGIAQACVLAMSRVVLVSNVSTMRRLLARRDEPVSVSSTMPSSSRALISVVPQENSTVTLTPRWAK